MTDINAGKLPVKTIDLKMLETEFYNPSNPPVKVKFGTSGHRGELGAGFCALHAKAIAQAVAKMHLEEDIKGKILVGGDTRLMSKVTAELCACVLAGNGLEVLLPRIPVPTPVFSYEILSKRACASLNGTASHNPPQDMGLKYNPSTGGPADSGITSKIEKYANYFMENPGEIKFLSLEEAQNRGLVSSPDVIENYVKALGEKINFDLIGKSGLKAALHPMGGTSLPFLQAVKARYKLDNVEIVSTLQNPSFNFIPLDHDGKTRMDPSSKYPMSPLIDLVMSGKYDFAGACDPDADRFGAATAKGGLLAPNHALCVMLDYLAAKNKSPKARFAGRTIGTTHLMDRIAAARGLNVEEVNVGFKYFVEGLLSGRLLMAGEESAGMSVTDWVTEKDGMLAVFLLLEIMSATGQDIAGLYKQLTELYGNPVYTRVDMPVAEEVKAKLKGFTEESLSGVKEVAGEKVLKIRTGDGVKVYLEESWFLVRPSGTEAIVKFYAETFKGEEHLNRILRDGRTVFGL